MIRNGIWDFFSLPDPRNKYKKWDIFLHQSRFTMDYVKHNVESIQKGSKSDKYTIQNLTCSRVYLGSTLAYALIHKVLKLVPLKATRPGVYVATMTTIISDSYASLVETLNHIKSLKIKYPPGENVIDCCDAILGGF